MFKQYLFRSLKDFYGNESRKLILTIISKHGIMGQRSNNATASNN